MSTVVFRVGDQVEIVRSIFNCGDCTCTSNHGRYQYGDLIEDIPFGSVGTIEKILHPNKFQIKIKNNKINFHPTEIKIISRHIKIPDPYLLRITSKTPVVIVNDRLFVADRSAEDKAVGELKIKTSGKIRVLPIIESASLLSLEELAYQQNGAEFKALQDSCVEEIVQEHKINLENESNARRRTLLETVFNKTFQILRKADTQEDRLDEVLGIKRTKKQPAKSKRKTKSPFQKAVDKIIKAIKKEKFEDPFSNQTNEPSKLDELLGFKPKKVIELSKQSRDYKPESVLGNVLIGKNIAIINGKVYYLSKSEDIDKNSFSLTLNGVTYFLIQIMDFSELIDEYKFELFRWLKLHTLENVLIDDPRIEEIAKENVGIAQFMKSKSYKEEDFGIQENDSLYIPEYVRRSESFIVTLKVPKHVLKLPKRELYDCAAHEGIYRSDVKERHYLFGEIKIGIAIWMNGKKIRFSKPRVLQSYGHPFVFTDRKICLGSYNFDPLYRMDPGEAIAKLLFDARGVLLSGYYGDVGPVTRLYKYSRKKISLKEVKKRKLNVTNTNFARRGRKNK